MMERLERTTVQLWEARRLAAYGDVPRGRLALLLLDNAAETMLRRIAASTLVWPDFYGGLLRQLRSVNADDEEGQRLKRQFELRTLSKRTRRQIERDFDALGDFVFRQDECTLDPELAGCLKILHRYPNAAYHGDTVRTDVLGPGIQIYFYLCCHLLKDQHFVVDECNVPPPGVLEVIKEAPPEAMPGGCFSSKQLGDLVADRLLADTELNHAQVAAALSQHLTARLTVLEKNLDEITAEFPPASRAMTLRLVQLAPTDPDDLQEDPPEDFWTRQLSVTQDVLDSWKVEAEELREIPAAHDALREFAAIEDGVAELEEPVQRFLEDIDRATQMRIDELRGK